MQSMEMIVIRLVSGYLVSSVEGRHRKNHRNSIHRNIVNHAVKCFRYTINPNHQSSLIVLFLYRTLFFYLRLGCGIVNKQNRIVGGQETEVNQYPWMALLTYGNRFYCGASLINDRYVMTAAHCVSGFNKDRIGVTLLEHDRTKPDDTELTKRKVMRIIRHAGYSPTNFNNDIGK